MTQEELKKAQRMWDEAKQSINDARNTTKMLPDLSYLDFYREFVPKALDKLEKAMEVIEAGKEDSKIAKIYGWKFTEFEQALKKWEAGDE